MRGENVMDGIPNSLTFYKVTFHGEAYVLAESEEEARKTYRIMLII